MFIMVDVLLKPDGNKPGMMPAVIARRKSFPEHDSDLMRLRMLLIVQNKIYARMFDSVAGFVFFAHGPSFQNGVGLGSPIPAPSATCVNNSTDLRCKSGIVCAGLVMPTVNLTRVLSEAGGISSVGGRIGGRISSVGTSGSSTIDPANVPTVG